MRRPPRLPPALVLLLATLGCAGGPAPAATPEATVIAFARALNQAHFDEAYALMSEEYRGRVSLDEFKRRLSENPEETLDLSRALGQVRGPADERATLRYGDDEPLDLVLGEGRWYVATNLVDYYDQSTPRAALRSFIRAMERQRYDVVMRLVPDADKEGVTPDGMREAWSGDGREDVERMLHNLRTHVDAPIEVAGNRATMPYAEQLRVQFVLEDGDWKIEDPE